MFKKPLLSFIAVAPAIVISPLVLITSCANSLDPNQQVQALAKQLSSQNLSLTTNQPFNQVQLFDFTNQPDLFNQYLKIDWQDLNQDLINQIQTNVIQFKIEPEQANQKILKYQIQINVQIGDQSAQSDLIELELPYLPPSANVSAKIATINKLYQDQSFNLKQTTIDQVIFNALSAYQNLKADAFATIDPVSALTTLFNNLVPADSLTNLKIHYFSIEKGIIKLQLIYQDRFGARSPGLTKLFSFKFQLDPTIKQSSAIALFNRLVKNGWISFQATGYQPNTINADNLLEQTNIELLLKYFSAHQWALSISDFSVKTSKTTTEITFKLIIDQNPNDQLTTLSYQNLEQVPSQS